MLCSSPKNRQTSSALAALFLGSRQKFCERASRPKVKSLRELDSYVCAARHWPQEETGPRFLQRAGGGVTFGDPIQQACQYR